MKKLGITLALAAMLALPAAARVRFGVSVGVPGYAPGHPTYCGPYYGCYPAGPYVYYGRPYYWHHHYRHPYRHYYR
jgi:hypothetical protein